MPERRHRSPIGGTSRHTEGKVGAKGVPISSGHKRQLNEAA
jgi:hypothetical protein